MTKRIGYRLIGWRYEKNESVIKYIHPHEPPKTTIKPPDQGKIARVSPHDVIRQSPVVLWASSPSSRLGLAATVKWAHAKGVRVRVPIGGWTRMATLNTNHP